MKKRNIAVIIGVLVVGLLAAVLYVLRAPAEASGKIEAPVLDTPTGETLDVDPKTSSSRDIEEMTKETTGGVGLFEIVQAESEVRFILDEVLGGKPTTVIGVTDQVAGQIEVDFDTPGNSRVGVLLINARTLKTNNGNRNRMIQNEILDTADYEFIQFTPTEINGLSGSSVGGIISIFTITGDLKIRNVTKEVTFSVEFSTVSPTRIEGFAYTVILRSDFDLQIPSVPNVANVSEEVILEIDFVAVMR
jgi:polyisoprenoid-binding protein YceI